MGRRQHVGEALGGQSTHRLVYHYFGSKEGLLDAATNPPQKWLESIAKVWTTPWTRWVAR